MRDMTAVLSVAEMRRADQAAMAGGRSGVTLMENAGRAVAEAICADYAAGPVLVLCGPGNNGGDGFVAARCLADAGRRVRVALLGARESLTGDAAHHAKLWRGPIAPLTSEAIPDLLNEAGLVVDALFGAGLSRPLEGAARHVAEALRRCCDHPVVAVDVPSGLCGDSGEIRGDWSIRAKLCVTFFRKKPGHLLLPGRVLCGKIKVADIGISDRVLAEIAPKIRENHPLLWAQALPRRRADSHKYDFGHAVVLGGSTMTGAARLAARAALRVGAGLVTLACPRESLQIYALSSPSLIVAPLEKDADFQSLLADPRKNAVLLGPGNGIGRATRARVRMALDAGKTVVLDADALTSFQDRPESLFQALGQACVLTPHEGEFPRLFPALSGDKLSRARAAARISGAVVVLKGADSVIADPDGRAAINANAPPELATAGSGDVLAGLVLGLLAQGMTPFDAACAAVWLHGQAATNIGPGLIAEDLTEALPKVLRDLAKPPGR